jgi:hypothetical protein
MPSSQVWITAVDQTEHAVDEAVYAAGLDKTGEYEAVCGALILAADMTTTPLRTCIECKAYVAARNSIRSLETRMARHRHRRTRWWQRHPINPAGAGMTPGPAPAGPFRRGRHAA